MLDVIWLIPAFPLVGFLLILLFGRRLGEPLSGYLASAMVLGSFVVSVGAYFDLLSMPEEERAHVETLFSWVPVDSLQIDMAFLADPLSITMCLFVTGIAFLIHLFAIGYMHGDPKFSKFFLYLNLFVLSMTLLVLGENLLVTFLGWEGVGTCSYLLISFWHRRESAATAGKKAFVTNRIGDWGFMLAMFLGFQAIGSVSYLDLNVAAEAGVLGETTATGIAMLLFVGAIGKSAQLPLYVWLPDAMAGPTPVSALIHAATMVTAGVFLMIRMNPMLAAAAEASTIVAWVGAITALFAATIAVAQNDIKKVLAYSTVSQLGYMFLAVGSGAYVAAIFHMVTHAFFKALLFLGSGSVIHGMHDEQDMRKMGALRKFMPVTAATFIVGWLAIAGVPPFAGFWSKDEILLFTLVDSPALYVIGLVTAVLTAFYMTRQVIMVFFGEAKWGSYANAEDAPDGEEEFASHGARRVQAARVAADHAVPAGRARRPGGRRWHHPAAVVRLHPAAAAPARGLAPAGGRVRRGRHHRHVDLRQQGVARPHRDRLCRRRDRRRSGDLREEPVPTVRARDPRRRLGLRLGDQRFHGWPGPEGVRGDRVVRQERHRRRRQRRRARHRQERRRGPPQRDRQRPQLRGHPRGGRRPPARLVRDRTRGAVMTLICVPRPRRPLPAGRSSAFASAPRWELPA